MLSATSLDLVGFASFGYNRNDFYDDGDSVSFEPYSLCDIDFYYFHPIELR